MSFNSLKMCLVIAICTAGLISSAYGECDPNSVTGVQTVYGGQTITLTPMNDNPQTGVTYTYLWTVKHYDSDKTLLGTVTVLNPANNPVTTISSTNINDAIVHFTIPTGTTVGDFYTINLLIQAGDGCINEQCIGKIVVGSGAAPTITLPPMPEICITYGTTSIPDSVYTATITNGGSYAVVWKIDGVTQTTATGVSTTTYTGDTLTHNWFGSYGSHTVYVGLVDMSGPTTMAYDQKTVHVYRRPVTGIGITASS